MKKFLKKKSTKAILILFALNTLVFLFMIYPWPQCPENYTPKAIEFCIVGANIGGAIFAFLCILIALFLIGLLIAEFLHFIRPNKSRIIAYVFSYILIYGLSTLIIGLMTAPLTNTDYMKKKYNCSTIDYATGEEKYPPGYTVDTYKYPDVCDDLKSAKGAQIDYLNGYAISGAVFVAISSIGIAVVYRKKPKK